MTVLALALADPLTRPPKFGAEAGKPRLPSQSRAFTELLDKINLRINALGRYSLELQAAAHSTPPLRTIALLLSVFMAGERGVGVDNVESDCRGSSRFGSAVLHFEAHCSE